MVSSAATGVDAKSSGRSLDLTTFAAVKDDVNFSMLSYVCNAHMAEFKECPEAVKCTCYEFYQPPHISITRTDREINGMIVGSKDTFRQEIGQNEEDAAAMRISNARQSQCVDLAQGADPSVLYDPVNARRARRAVHSSKSFAAIALALHEEGNDHCGKEKDEQTRISKKKGPLAGEMPECPQDVEASGSKKHVWNRGGGGDDDDEDTSVGATDLLPTSFVAKYDGAERTESGLFSVAAFTNFFIQNLDTIQLAKEGRLGTELVLYFDPTNHTKQGSYNGVAIVTRADLSYDMDGSKMVDVVLGVDHFHLVEAVSTESDVYQVMASASQKRPKIDMDYSEDNGEDECEDETQYYRPAKKYRARESCKRERVFQKDAASKRKRQMQWKAGDESSTGVSDLDNRGVACIVNMVTRIVHLHTSPEHGNNYFRHLAIIAECNGRNIVALVRRACVQLVAQPEFAQRSGSYVWVYVHRETFKNFPMMAPCDSSAFGGESVVAGVRGKTHEAPHLHITKNMQQRSGLNANIVPHNYIAQAPTPDTVVVNAIGFCLGLEKTALVDRAIFKFNSKRVLASTYLTSEYLPFEDGPLRLPEQSWTDAVKVSTAEDEQQAALAALAGYMDNGTCNGGLPAENLQDYIRLQLENLEKVTEGGGVGKGRLTKTGFISGKRKGTRTDDLAIALLLALSLSDNFRDANLREMNFVRWSND